MRWIGAALAATVLSLGAPAYGAVSTAPPPSRAVREIAAQTRALSALSRVDEGYLVTVPVRRGIPPTDPASQRALQRAMGRVRVVADQIPPPGQPLPEYLRDQQIDASRVFAVYVGRDRRVALYYRSAP